jgi:hypothetical protein
MAFSYNAVTNIVTYIHAAGDGFGDTAGNPCTLQHVYDFAVDPAQGLAAEKAQDSYVFPFTLYFPASSSTYFRIKNENLKFSVILSSITYVFDVRCNAEINDARISMADNTNHAMNLQGGTGTFISVNYTIFSKSRIMRLQNNVTVYDSIFLEGVSNQLPRHTSTELRRIISFSDTGLDPRASATVVDFKCVNNRNGVFIGQGSYTLYNIDVINSSELDIIIFHSGVNRQCVLVDSRVRLDKIELNGVGTTGSANYGTLELKSTLQVYTQTGVSVRLVDANDNEIYSKILATGECSDEIAYYQRYTTFTTDVTINREPFKLVFSKSGYETYEIPELYMTEDLGSGIRRGRLQPTVVRATLIPAIPVMITNKGIAIKANKENYGNNRELAIMP